MKIIACADKGWGIGKGGDLLYNIPEDMKFFRTTTSGKTVVMGRATLESLPGGKPLLRRRNIILSSTLDSVEGAEVAKNIDELLKLLENETFDAPKLWMNTEKTDFYSFTKEDFKLENYKYSEFDVKIPVAV